MFGLGVPEMLVILVVALVVFGPGKLPELGSGLGRALRDFRKAFEGKDEAADEVEKAEGETPEDRPPPSA